MASLHEVEIHKLRPTQITVGMIEVRDKRARLEGMKKHEQRDFMQAHPIPAVWGPDGKLYITDHHHLGRAASEAQVDTGFFAPSASGAGSLADFVFRAAPSTSYVKREKRHRVPRDAVDGGPPHYFRPRLTVPAGRRR